MQEAKEQTADKIAKNHGMNDQNDKDIVLAAPKTAKKCET